MSAVELLESNGIGYVAAITSLFAYADVSNEGVAGEGTAADCSKIGAGGYGAVHLMVERATTRRVAVKHLELRKMSRKGIDYAVAEVVHLRLLQQTSSIVQLVSAHHDRARLYIVLEAVESPPRPAVSVSTAALPVDLAANLELRSTRRFADLLDYVNLHKVLTPARVLVVAVQLLAALCDTHRRGIVHRDVKLENIVISSDVSVTEGEGGCLLLEETMRVVLIDFGLSRRLADGSNDSVVDSFALGSACGTKEEEAAVSYPAIAAPSSGSLRIDTAAGEWDGSDVLMTPCGTHNYFATEILSAVANRKMRFDARDAHDKWAAGSVESAQSIDVFSVGIVLFVLLFGKSPCPVATKDLSALMRCQTLLKHYSQLEARLRTAALNQEAGLRRSVTDLLAAMLRADPAQRPCAGALLRQCAPLVDKHLGGRRDRVVDEYKRAVGVVSNDTVRCFD